MKYFFQAGVACLVVVVGAICIIPVSAAADQVGSSKKLNVDSRLLKKPSRLSVHPSIEALKKIIDGVSEIELAADKFTSLEEKNIKISNLLANTLGSSKTLKFEFESRPGDWHQEVFTEGSPWRATTHYIEYDNQRNLLIVPSSLELEPLSKMEPPFNWKLVPGEKLSRYLTAPVIPVWRVERKVGNYEAKNSFGATAQVLSIETNVWGIHIVDEKQREQLTNDKFFNETKLPPSEARNAVSRLIWVVEVEPVQSGRFTSPVTTVHHGKTATIDHPLKTSKVHRYLNVVLVKLQILDPLSGLVVFDLFKK